jgi:hypothetical protein
MAGRRPESDLPDERQRILVLVPINEAMDRASAPIVGAHDAVADSKEYLVEAAFVSDEDGGIKGHLPYEAKRIALVVGPETSDSAQHAYLGAQPSLVAADAGVPILMTSVTNVEVREALEKKFGKYIAFAVGDNREIAREIAKGVELDGEGCQGWDIVHDERDSYAKDLQERIRSILEHDGHPPANDAQGRQAEPDKPKCHAIIVGSAKWLRQKGPRRIEARHVWLSDGLAGESLEGLVPKGTRIHDVRIAVDDDRPIFWQTVTERAVALFVNEEQSCRYHRICDNTPAEPRCCAVIGLQEVTLNRERFVVRERK